MRNLGVLFVALYVLSVVANQFVASSAETGYPPSYSRRTIVWREGEDIWILEAVVFTEMPWYIGRMADIDMSVTLTSYSTVKDFEIILIARVTLEQRELTSKFLGVLTANSPRAVDRVSMILSPPAFPEAYLGPVTRDLTIVIEGYIRGKQHIYSFSIPIVVLSQSPDLRIRIFINGVEDYFAFTEALARVNFTAVILNVGRDAVLGGMVRLYLNQTLIGESPIAQIYPGESFAYNFTVFRVFNAGIHMVRVVITYVLPGGTRREAACVGIIEVVRDHEIVVNVDRSVVVEGANVTISGRVEPPLNGIAFIESLGGTAWVTVGIARVSSGLFSIQLRAEEVPIGLDYVTRVYRVRVPLSLVGGKAELISRSLTVTVFSVDRVLDMVTDLSIDFGSEHVFTGSNLIVSVRVRPPLPVCVPVKIVYMGTHLPSWIRLGETEACWGHSVANLTINLSPGRYLVKSIATSKYRSVESLPKELIVLVAPQVVIEHPARAIYGERIKVVVRVTEVFSELPGFLEVHSKGSMLSNTSLTYTGGRAEAMLTAAEDTIYLRACALVANRPFCSQSSIEVLRPTISVSPKSLTAETGQQFSLTVTVSPGQEYDLKATIMRNGVEQHSRDLRTGPDGTALVTLRAPDALGKYTVRISIPGSNVYAEVQLNVIETVKTLSLELTRRNVRPLDKVTVKVSILPQPQTAKQVVISVLSGGKWLPVAYELIQGRSEVQISFEAPGDEGVYQVRAEIPDLALVSNTEYLTVSRGLLLPNELIYIVASVVATAGAIVAILGGRRRR